jgi:hypothetical protein
MLDQQEHDTVVTAIAIMDTHGTWNPEHNSLMLWARDWLRLRSLLLSLLGHDDGPKGEAPDET